MQRQAARLLMRMGMALFVMALLIRFAEPAGSSRAADDLALAASVAVVVVGALFSRFGRD